MKNYTLAALIASFAGWFAAALIYAIGYYILDKTQAIMAVYIVAYITFVISVLANILFVQLPRYFIKKAFFRLKRMTFALNYAALALVSFILLFGRSFGRNPIEQLTYLNAITNGFVLGFVFYSIWKPTN